MDYKRERIGRIMGEGQGFAILARPDATDQGPIQSSFRSGAMRIASSAARAAQGNDFELKTLSVSSSGVFVSAYAETRSPSGSSQMEEKTLPPVPPESPMQGSSGAAR